MTQLLILVTAIVLCGAEHLPDYKPGTLISSGVGARAAVYTDPTKQCEDLAQTPEDMFIGFSCSSNNCENLLICDPNGVGTESQCSSTAKYCGINATDGSGSCTETQPDRCKTTTVPPVDFLCNSRGFFPDPTNCELYYYCTGPQANPLVYNCGSGFAFDIRTNECKKQNSPSDCATLICKPGVVEVITYAPNPAYYAICGTGRTVVLKCPDEIYQVFNTLSLSCEVSCKAEGNQEDRLNCNKYNYCYISGGQWVYTSHACPINTANPGNLLMAFNNVTKKCDPLLPVPCKNAVDK